MLFGIIQYLTRVQLATACVELVAQQPYFGTIWPLKSHVTIRIKQVNWKILKVIDQQILSRRAAMFQDQAGYCLYNVYN